MSRTPIDPELVMKERPARVSDEERLGWGWIGIICIPFIPFALMLDAYRWLRKRAREA